MMSPAASPMNQQYSEDSSEKDIHEGESTSLMQRNYLASNGNGNTSNTNAAAARQRKTGGDGGGGSNAQTPYSAGSHSMSTSSFSPPPVKGPQHPYNAKDHGRKYSQARYAGLVSYLTRISPFWSWNDDPIDDEQYYQDDFNESSWSCSFGTGEDSGIWMNTSDQAGTILAFFVWFLLGYSSMTITLLAQTGGIPYILAMLYVALCCMALASHAKTQFTDPGAIPSSAVPAEALRAAQDTTHCMCSQCQTYKPPLSHHCRICNRCISRMDHHCPWMNNCIGIGNLKHFCLFLFYTWICSAFALTLLGWNYFFCGEEECMFQPVLVHLVRVMTMLCGGSFLFTSSMLMNVCYGVMTGIGTIDRLKKKANGTILDSEEEPILMVDLFGTGPYWTWIFPIDPVFEDYDRVLGYSTPQRLLREQLRRSEDGMSAISIPVSSDLPAKQEQFMV
jgi:hypothetical protein